MLSKKNQNQAFFYEEEFNQTNESLDINKNQESIDLNNNDNKNPIFILGNEELSMEPEKMKLFLTLIKNVYPSEIKVCRDIKLFYSCNIFIIKI